MATVRLGLSLIANMNLQPRQIDVIGAYLEAPIKSEIYVKPPPGITISPGKVLKLDKALYGCRQAGQDFTKYWDTHIVDLGYTQSITEPSFFFRFKPSPIPNNPMLFDFGIWHTDDNFSGFSRLNNNDDNDSQPKECVHEIGKHLPIEDKGIPKSYLGMSFGFKYQMAYAYQPGLIDDIVVAARMEHSKPILTPLKFAYKIPTDGLGHEGFHNVSFPQILGAINFLTCCTRPDIANTIRVLSQFSANPPIQVWKQLNNLVGYLKTMKDYVLTFGIKPPFLLRPPHPNNRENEDNMFTV